MRRVIRQKSRRRGSLLLAILFMVMCSFIAFAFVQLLPTDARVTLTSQRREAGSQAAEAGIIEAIAYLEDGGDENAYEATPLESQSGDLSDNWTYEVLILSNGDTYDPDEGGPAGNVTVNLPDGYLLAVSRAKQLDSTYLQANAYLRETTNKYFLDMMRVQEVGTVPAGMGTEYFNSIHTNAHAIADVRFGYGSDVTFHSSFTWSDETQSDVDIINQPPDVDKLINHNPEITGETAEEHFYWTSERWIPELDPNAGNNIFTGDPDGDAGTHDSLLSLVLNGGSAPLDVSAGGPVVTAIPGGGVYVNDTDCTIKLDLLENFDGTTSLLGTDALLGTVNANYSNGPSGNGDDGTDASYLTGSITGTSYDTVPEPMVDDDQPLVRENTRNDTSDLIQMMTITPASGGDPYYIVFDEGSVAAAGDESTRIYQGATPATAVLVDFDGDGTVENTVGQDVIAGLSDEVVWVERDITNITGVNKAGGAGALTGKQKHRAFVAGGFTDTADVDGDGDTTEFIPGNIDLTLDATGAPLVRADIEPAQLESDTDKPFVDGARTDYGFTLATTGNFNYRLDGTVAKFAGQASDKWYFTYSNVISTGDIVYDSTNQAKVTIYTAGSMMSTGALTLNAESNDLYKFSQDPGNMSFPLAPPDPMYEVFHYQEDHVRGGR